MSDRLERVVRRAAVSLYGEAGTAEKIEPSKWDAAIARAVARECAEIADSEPCTCNAFGAGVNHKWSAHKRHGAGLSIRREFRVEASE